MKNTSRHVRFRKYGIISTLLAVLLLAALAMTACEGPVGPAGPPGERGNQGTSGSNGYRIDEKGYLWIDGKNTGILIDEVNKGRLVAKYDNEGVKYLIHYPFDITPLRVYLQYDDDDEDLDLRDRYLMPADYVLYVDGNILKPGDPIRAESEGFKTVYVIALGRFTTFDIEMEYPSLPGEVGLIPGDHDGDGYPQRTGDYWYMKDITPNYTASGGEVLMPNTKNLGAAPPSPYRSQILFELVRYREVREGIYPVGWNDVRDFSETFIEKEAKEGAVVAGDLYSSPKGLKADKYGEYRVRVTLEGHKPYDIEDLGMFIPNFDNIDDIKTYLTATQERKSHSLPYNVNLIDDNVSHVELNNTIGIALKAGGSEIRVNLDLSKTKYTTLKAAENPRGIDGVFYDCRNLASIILPENLATIGSYAFTGCLALASIDLETPENLATIGSYAFSHCESLARITLPKLSKIEKNAFEYTALTTVDIPNTVIKIEEFAFTFCKEFVNVSIPTTVQEIEKGVFANCAKLVKIEVLPYNSGSYTNNSDDGVLYKKIEEGNLTLVAYPSAKVSSEFSILPIVRTIESHAFSGSPILTKVIIPSQVETINDNAFEYLDLLGTVVFNGSTMTPANFKESAFYQLGDLRAQYFAPDGGSGTYIRVRSAGSNDSWRRQL